MVFQTQTIKLNAEVSTAHPLQQDSLRYSTFVDKNHELENFKRKIFNFLPQ